MRSKHLASKVARLATTNDLLHACRERMVTIVERFHEYKLALVGCLCFGADIEGTRGPHQDASEIFALARMSD